MVALNPELEDAVLDVAYDYFMTLKFSNRLSQEYSKRICKEFMQCQLNSLDKHFLINTQGNIRVRLAGIVCEGYDFNHNVTIDDKSIDSRKA